MTMGIRVWLQLCYDEGPVSGKEFCKEFASEREFNSWLFAQNEHPFLHYKLVRREHDEDLPQDFRGFESLLGETIVSIDTTKNTVVTFFTDTGKVVDITALGGHIVSARNIL